jgi:2-succinyl-5-enolpyruvyl-6-hydroxy-3-cyclohexene-1-carboxylate synthase
MPEPTAPNPSTALAVVVMDELVRNGVRHLALAPGSRSAALALAAADRPDLSVWVEIDERSAAFLAVGIARGSGAPAAVVTTSGTAAANLLPAMVEADLGGVPLVVLTADRPPELRHAGANQTIDQVGLYGGAVRWACDLGVPEDRPGAGAYWRSSVCRAVAEARGRGGPPGPVHLNLAFREPVVPATDDGRTVGAAFTGPLGGRPGGAPWTRVVRSPLPEVALDRRWLEVERGIVVAGDARLPPEERRKVDRLAAALGWPLVAEPAAGWRPPQTVTMAHHLLGHPGFRARHRPDAALVVGRAGLSRNLAAALAGVPRVVADPWGWPDPERDAEAVLTGFPSFDPGEVPKRESGWRRAWLEAEAAVRKVVDAALDESDLPSEPRTARDAARAVPDGGLLVAASSMPVRDLDWFMPARDVEVVCNRGASGIDGFVSTALGVAAHAGPGRVAALAGDLSLLHDAGGFLVRPQPDCVFVVVNNDGGGIFSFLPQAGFPEHFERVFGTPHGRSFERLAAFHDLTYRPIERADELTPAVQEGLLAGGLHLLEVRTERAENVAVHRRIAAAVGAALD